MGGSSVMIKEITKIDDCIYSLVVESEDGVVYETICNVKSSVGHDGSQRNYVTFDSDEFQKAIMLGQIIVKEVASAVIDFHNPIRRA
jgi:hypothetical protein